MSGIPWSVYMVRCADESLYTGVALDVPRRFAEHIEGRGAKYTKAKKAVSLAYSAQLASKSQAYAVEWRIKRLTKAQKEALIADQPPTDPLLEFLHMPGLGS